MTTLAEHNLYWCVHRMPKSVTELLRKRPGELVVAGGFIRACIAHEEVADIDIFSSSLDVAKAVAYEMALLDHWTVINTANAITVKTKPIPVQFIHRWTYKTPEQLLASFDFTISKAAIWYGTAGWSSLVDDSFYSDLAAKRLVYTSPVREEEVGGSILRVLKFYQRGYRIPLDSLGSVMSRLMRAVNFESVDAYTSEDREKKIAKVITGLLREVDPSIDLEHTAHLPTLDAGATES